MRCFSLSFNCDRLSCVKSQKNEAPVKSEHADIISHRFFMVRTSLDRYHILEHRLFDSNVSKIKIILRRLTPRYRRASLLGLQEGFKNGFQNGAELGGQFWRHLGALLGRLGGILRHLGAVLAHRTPSRRLWGGSWGRFWLIWAHLGGVLGAQDGPNFLPRWPKMPLRCFQDSPRFDFQ